jgi:hypothetical protein
MLVAVIVLAVLTFILLLVVVKLRMDNKAGGGALSGK